MRRAANTWFDETLLSRLNDKAKGCIIIVMQRLHEDDLVGHVLAKGEKWDVVNFPAIAEIDELFTWSNAFGTGRHLRRQGDVLHPERESREVLEGLRRQMGTYLYSAQYQQQPIPREGARINIDWFRRYDSVAEIKFDRIIQSWDTASKIGELNDYSVCTTWGVKGENIYLLHVFKKRLLTPDLEKALIELCSGWRADRVIIEDHVSGTALVQYLPRKGFYKAEAFTPQGDKAMRMEAHTGMIEYGRVFIPKEAPWLDDYLHELQAFPNGRYDDQVDSTSQALEWINTRGREPGIIGYYRQLHEEKTRAAQAPSGATIKLRPPQHGMQIQLSGGPLIFPDKDGICHVREGLLDPVALGSLMGRGWTRVP
jgi:predicted phage terminase large subunit-like protein